MPKLVVGIAISASTQMLAYLVYACRVERMRCFLGNYFDPHIPSILIALKASTYVPVRPPGGRRLP
ncbi:hypothetical protein AG1IA_06010 [Rhizoctonia solani AG-1 IA]|uniref:Uncharacterized protein n=1 Tax=Thanatephorus cucumeris (strain AG1-IA) TaxID=983506 RepID=L8WPN7_THACA|nr:hypothetical protein AG1IA_06010 [Rhizoctonia solani AG-1 IA]